MPSAIPAADIAASADARAWPFEEARKLIQRLDRIPGGKDKVVIFETGYGPSGLPHIGTFGEVARTTMVRHAFNVLTEGKRQSRLICFSDDMDGLRKIPENVPNKDMLRANLNRPLSSVPDPFTNQYESFAHHNNAMLRRFLDQFGFDYEFASATEYYKTGKFDAMLQRALERYDDIMAVMLPTLGPERQATYSPFLPISPTTGRVLYVPMKGIDAKAGTITFADEDAKVVTMPVTGGRTKLQWKPDFGMRFAALGVDFEMFGKDHQANAPIYDRICEILGVPAPHHFVFELFLDEKGEKISKSKGNGISLEQWLTYASPESLSLFNFHKPRAAKKLFFDVIPKTMDEYLTFLAKVGGEDGKARLDNPVWHIHSGTPPAATLPISFGLLLNLVSVSNTEDKKVLWGFIQRYAPEANPHNQPVLDKLVGYAINYYRDFELPKKTYRVASGIEIAALQALDAALATAPATATAEDLQNIVYEAGKSNGYAKENLRAWFQAIYEVLLGTSQGPRFGSFIKLYGIKETRALIAKGLAGGFLK